jgi:hypothetical protein
MAFGNIFNKVLLLRLALNLILAYIGKSSLIPDNNQLTGISAAVVCYKQRPPQGFVGWGRRLAG